jgi:hypothetical protein
MPGAGPILLFDKSMLQSLSVDEAVWLDTFYFPCITPLFFTETLADLEKEVQKGRSPEDVVTSDGTYGLIVFCFFLLQTIIPTAFSSHTGIPTAINS